MEQPKPPWFVAWIELGVHAIGRRNVDLLILFSTVVPYALLMLAVTWSADGCEGPGAGFVALVCLAASPLSLAFGGKVMVETFLALWVLLVYSLTALYLTAPSRKCAAALGLAVGAGAAHQADDRALPSRAIHLRLVREVRGGAQPDDRCSRGSRFASRFAWRWRDPGTSRTRDRP